MISKLVLATNNKDKVKEIKNLLIDLPLEILTSDDFENFPDVEETGSTLQENAILKAKAISEFTSLPSLADDTGLEVDALNGAPGVYSSRYAGESVSYEDNCNKLLNELQSIPREKRTAKFKCVIAIAWNPDNIETVEGIADGIITTDSIGSEGFGYDPIFYSCELKKRFSEVTIEEKNIASHRGKALRKAKELIKSKKIL